MIGLSPEGKSSPCAILLLVPQPDGLRRGCRQRTGPVSECSCTNSESTRPRRLTIATVKSGRQDTLDGLSSQPDRFGNGLICISNDAAITSTQKRSDRFSPIFLLPWRRCVLLREKTCWALDLWADRTFRADSLSARPAQATGDSVVGYRAPLPSLLGPLRLRRLGCPGDGARSLLVNWDPLRQSP